MIKLSIEEKIFSDRIIISDFNLTIQKNEFVVITGASGAGKSTLLNIIGFIDTSYHGRYVFNGYDVSKINHKKQLYLRGRYFG
ncbi:ATP-binding cassette domain-containing protein, partial [Escherichia coli]|nr:ATP-binding cassette domain-containing protein [Escherichia coli]